MVRGSNSSGLLQFLAYQDIPMIHSVGMYSFLVVAVYIDPKISKVFKCMGFFLGGYHVKLRVYTGPLVSCEVLSLSCE